MGPLLRQGTSSGAFFAPGEFLRAIYRAGGLLGPFPGWAPPGVGFWGGVFLPKGATPAPWGFGEPSPGGFPLSPGGSRGCGVLSRAKGGGFPGVPPSPGGGDCTAHKRAGFSCGPGGPPPWGPPLPLFPRRRQGGRGRGLSHRPPNPKPRLTTFGGPSRVARGFGPRAPEWGAEIRQPKGGGFAPGPQVRFCVFGGFKMVAPPFKGEPFGWGGTGDAALPLGPIRQGEIFGYWLSGGPKKPRSFSPGEKFPKKAFIGGCYGKRRLQKFPLDPG